MIASGEERREIEEINGERVKVVYKTDGQKVEIVSAEKENPQTQQESKNETESSGQEKEKRPVQQNVDTSKTDIELTPAEKEKLQKKLEVKVEQETKEKRARIYDKEISPHLFSDASSSERPTLILLAGQGGSGKSKLTEKQEERFAGKECAVTIDPDELRSFNPNYHDYIREDSRTAGDKTHADAKEWANSAFLEGVANKYNLILDGTGGNKDAIKEKIEYARLNGYQVDFLAVAANQAESWHGVLNRHEAGKKEDALHPEQAPQARYVPKRAHDPAAVGITETLACVEHEGLADRVAVFARGKYDAPIYENTNARQGGTVAGAEAFEKERNRARTPEEMEKRATVVEEISKKMGDRGASQNERAELAALSFEGKDKGFSETARDITPDRRPDISAQEYIKNPEARKEVRAQAEERIKAYAGELRQKGFSEELVSKVENNLQRKLDNPAAAYGIKEGFDLRDKKKQADTLTSRKDQEEYCDKKERFLTDIRTVKKAFGADIKERTPQQQEADKSRASWDRHGRLTMVTVKKQMAERNVPAAEQEKKLESMRRDLQKAKTQSVKRQYKQNAEQVSGQKQGGGGGGGHVQRQSMRHCKYPIFPRNDFIL